MASAGTRVAGATEHNEWRDFVLARITAFHESAPAVPLPRDNDWEDAYRVVLKPAEGLSKGQRATVVREYAMKAGQLVVAIPRAMRLYAIRRWGLDRPTTRLTIIKGTEENRRRSGAVKVYR